MTTNNSPDDRLDTWLDAQYSAFVHDLTGTLDIETGLAEAIQPSRFTELVTDLDGLLNLGAGLTAILPTDDPSLLAAPNRVVFFGPGSGGIGVTEWSVSELVELAVGDELDGARSPYRRAPATLSGTPAGSAPGWSFLGGFQLGRSGRIAAAVTFTLVLGLALAVMVPRGNIGGDGDSFFYGGPETLTAFDPASSSSPDPARSARSVSEFWSQRLVPSEPTPVAASPGSLMRVSAVSVSSFDRRGNLSRPVVQVTTTGTGPVQLILGYGSGRQGDSGPGHPSMVITRTLAGSTSYSVTDYRSLPAGCTGYSFVLVTTTPAPDTGPRFAELALGSCPVEATPHSAPPPAVPNESPGSNESSAHPSASGEP